jgi:hypothetical protein
VPHLVLLPLEIMPLRTAMHDASAPTSGSVAHHTELARWTMAEAISKLTPRRNSPVPTSDAEPFNLSELTADIVAALVANNALPIADLPALIQSVHGALAQLASGPVMMGLPALFHRRVSHASANLTPVRRQSRRQDP